MCHYHHLTLVEREKIMFFHARDIKGARNIRSSKICSTSSKSAADWRKGRFYEYCYKNIYLV